jgi:hypothetical protein
MHEEVFSEQETSYTEGNRKIVHECLQLVYTRVIDGWKIRVEDTAFPVSGI